ncbi:MAG: hypothetical protein EOP12_02840 [Pseudomonas sp.]|nr:MAG: hypothetical protein EOP12_02840 [Pseudomonas sp.]
MQAYFAVEPEVAGGLGANTSINRATVPAEFTKLHYVFEGWQGDALIESTPCFLVTEELAVAIRKERLSGVSFDEVEVSTSPEFNDLHLGLHLPNFLWLKIEGHLAKDDFALSKLMLVASGRALAVLERYGLAHATVVPFA